MRTTLDLDDALVAALMERHPNASKTEAIETAIREYIRTDAIAKLRAMAGRMNIQDLSKELRAGDRHT
jgi:Arc/MetJ family transcription regulator